jgi:hypothetical protein
MNRFLSPWLVLLGFLGIAAFFLLTEHRAHVFGVVPYLLTLVMFPLLVWMYARLARAEEREVAREFGEVYAGYAAATDDPAQAGARTSAMRPRRRLEETMTVPAPPARVFAWLDDPRNTGWHMSRPSIAMLGGALRLERLSAMATARWGPMADDLAGARVRVHSRRALI